MGEELDYTTLKWVKDEIQDSLDQTRQALETYVENPGDATQARFCATYLHQVYGTLQMVEIYGGALLAEEMEKVANALFHDEIAQREDAYEVLMRAILQLPAYLEGLERGQMDMPLVLLPLLNDLRAARGENLLSENAFFAPDLGVAPPRPQLPPGKTYPDIQTYARKLRPVFQVSLLGWYRDRDTAGSLKKLAAVLRELQNASQTESGRRLWWVVGGVIEALIDGGLETGSSLKLLMGQLDQQIKRLIDEGEAGLETSPPTELLKNCLYYVATAQSEGPRVSSLKQAFNLTQLLPYGGALEAAMDNLKGSNVDLLESVSAVIKDDLLAVKDQLDIFVRNSQRTVAELAPLGDGLHRIADTLVMLGFGDLRKVIQGQAERIRALVAAGEDPQDPELMEIASALLYVEGSLENLATSRGAHSEAEAPDLSIAEDESPVLMPASEQAQIVNLVIGESRELLTDVKEGLNTFAAEGTSFEPIQEVPAKLAQIRGALAVMNLPRPAALLESAIRYVRDDVLGRQQVPDGAALDALADVITSIEYYLEAIEEGRGHPDTILTVAELSVKQLGYPLAPTESAGAGVPEEIGAEAPPPPDFGFGPETESEEGAAPAPEAPELMPGEALTLEEAADVAGVGSEPAMEAEAAPPETAEESAVPLALAEPGAVGEGAEEEESDVEETIDEEILEIFLEEADEVLGIMTDCLHAWRADNDDRKSLETLRRSYHTLKGSGRLAGATVMGDFAWAFESMLNRVLDGKIVPSVAMFSLLEQAETTLHALLAHLKGEAPARPPVRRLMTLADTLAEGGEISLVDAPAGEAAPAEAPPVESEFPEPALELDAGLGETPLEAAEPAFPTPLETETPEAPAPEGEAVSEEEGEAISITEESVAELTASDAGIVEASVTEEPAIEEVPIEMPAAEAEAAPLFDPALAEVFRKETEAHLTALREFITNHSAVGPFPVSEDLHRALHTLRGSARMAKVASIADLSEPMDRYVRTLLERDIPLDHEGLAALEELMDRVAEAAQVFDVPHAPLADSSALVAHIERLHQRALATPLPEETQVEAGLAETTPPAAEPFEEDRELLVVFLEEAVEILSKTDDLLQRWPARLDDPELVAELQRDLHTLKGSARLANIHAIGDLTHAMESLLEGVSKVRRSAAADLPPLIQDCLDWLQQAVEQVRDGVALSSPSDLLARLAQWSASAATEAEAEVAGAPVGGESEIPELTLDDLGEAEDEFIAAPSEFAAEEPSAPAETPETMEAEAFEEEDIELAPMEMAPPSPAQEAFAATADYDADLLEIFLEEAEEIQETTEQILDQWSRDYDNLAHVAELQRALHTLKGGARMANITAVGDLAHAMESLLERVNGGLMAPEPRFPALLQSCHDWLGEGLAQARRLQAVAPPTHLMAQIEAALRGEAPPRPEAPGAAEEPAEAEGSAEESDLQALETTAAESAAESEEATEEIEELTELAAFELPGEGKAPAATPAAGEEQVRVRADLLNDLVNHSGEINIYSARIAQQLSAWRFNLAELDQTVTRLREQLRKFEMETEAQIIYRHETEGASHAEDFDPLEMDRFSTMQQLSRGMVESLGDLTSIQSLLEDLSGDTDTLLLQQQRVTSELQEGLMHTRMVAFSSILPRLRRIVRQTASETGKQVKLTVTGAEGELDRTQLNRIVPALEHILRNAVDHGIETPAGRAATGKPDMGEVSIDFAHQGSEVVLTIRDDGAGLDIAALREKAIEKGRLLPDADLSDQELTTFILESGFSTAKEVTQISGRGVGMDVVNTEIKQLGGTLHIDTEAGQGTSFVIRLPLTVLVNQALMVQVGEATYAIQLPNVEHVIRVSHDELAPLVEGKETHLDYAGNQYQYMSLSRVLTGMTPALPAGNQRVPLLLLRSGDHRAVMQVDTLLGRQEIVIKSVGPQLSTVNVLSGATILPDGEVALILDVGNLVRSLLSQTHGAAEPLLPATEQAASAKEKRLTVMVVDDSITVRKVTERLLSRYDFDTITAKDGVDALTVMLDQVPDIMLLDVEMPRMDGYELATTMRNDPRLKAVPIIMITSRSGEKHRQRAMDIGVNEYMGKPYQEQELIENIRTLTGVKC